MPIGNKPYPVKKGVTNGYPTHVPNGDGGMYGDFTKMSQSDYGSRPKKGVLNQREDSSWKYPSPTKGKR
jgi:hypothetical protein